MHWFQIFGIKTNLHLIFPWTSKVPSHVLVHIYVEGRPSPVSHWWIPGRRAGTQHLFLGICENKHWGVDFSLSALAVASQPRLVPEHRASAAHLKKRNFKCMMMQANPEDVCNCWIAPKGAMFIFSHIIWWCHCCFSDCGSPKQNVTCCHSVSQNLCCWLLYIGFFFPPLAQKCFSWTCSSH